MATAPNVIGCSRKNIRWRPLLQTQDTVKPLTYDAGNPKTKMFLVSSCSRCCPSIEAGVNSKTNVDGAAPTDGAPTTSD